ncbi:hypothetical protein vseg_013073 [Gypsophila vaccaria]
MQFLLKKPYIFTIILTLILKINPNSSALIMGLRKNHHRSHHHNISPPFSNNNNNNNNNNGTKTCNVYVGSWVRDDSYPVYQSFDCPFIDPEFNCQLFGRPDSNYLKFRWEPATCQLPRFDGVEFVERMRNRSVMFVGDSLGRNQWESLICMISSSLSSSSPTQIIRGDPLSTFNFLDYGTTISFYRAPYLVDVDTIQGKRILMLDEIYGNANAWRGVDVLVFNTGHWWTHKGSLQGWDFMETRGMWYQDMDRLSAMDHGLKTWAKWIDSNIDATKTRVFFQSISPTHYDPSEWNPGTTPMTKNCYGETMPASGIAYPADGYPVADAGQMKVLNSVLTQMSTPTYFLDITMLSAMRKDGHPSIYSGDLTPQQRANPYRSADCSHWCLPGLPDTWNQLFYTALLY